MEQLLKEYNWLKLMEVAVDKRDIELMTSLSMEQVVVIRFDGKDSETAKIGRKVRPGCPMSQQESNTYIHFNGKKPWSIKQTV